jgi:endonuclease G
MTMKKFTLLLILQFVSIVAFSQSKKDSVYVKNAIFEMVYSETLEQPKWVKYTVQCAENTVSRKGLDFYTEKTIHTSNGDDYAKNEYDKGHMAPAAAFGCDIALLKMTFTYLNSALQHQSLNRGPWKELEEYERTLAKSTDDVQVYIVLEFSTNPSKVSGGASIPLGFYKTVSSTKLGLKSCYYFKNVDPGKNKTFHQFHTNCN